MSEVLEREVPTMAPEQSMGAMVSRAEFDMQVATAHRFPRSITNFRQEALAMVTLSEAIADECIYALPRDGKTIEGPSARFAEVVASAWGNCRAGARVVDDKGQFVIAQGVFHDLQRNVAITYEVQRRIVNKNGSRFSADMIGVTANAACSIALRNAVLKGVPKAFWSEMYEAARKVVMGDFKTLANKRASALEHFQRFGVKPEQVFEKFGVAGEADITLEHIVTMKGLLTALKDGDTTVEEQFAPKETPKAAPGKGVAGLRDALKKDEPAKEPPASTLETLLADMDKSQSADVADLVLDQARELSEEERAQLRAAYDAKFGVKE